MRNPKEKRYACAQAITCATEAFHYRVHPTPRVKLAIHREIYAQLC